MDSAVIRFGLLSLMSTLAACVPTGDPPAAVDAGAMVTYTKDVQPILMAKCSPCHAGQNQGRHNIATNYADAHKEVDSIDSVGCWKDESTATPTMPRTVGECSLISARNGRMPMAMRCDQNLQPPPTICVTPAEQEVMAAWVAAGMPQ